MVAVAAAHAAGGGADPRGRAPPPQSAGRPPRQGTAAAGDRRRLVVGAGVDDTHRPCRAVDPARRARRPSGGAGRHRPTAARRSGRAARRAAPRGGPHHPARLPAQTVADRSCRRRRRHRQDGSGRQCLCRVAERRAAGRRHRPAHRAAAPLQRPRSRAPRPGDHAPSSLAAGRGRPRPQGACAASGGGWTAQGRDPGLRRPGPCGGPHRPRVRRQRKEGRRRVACAARTA